LDSAAPVAQSLIKQMNATKPFEAVGQKDPSKVGKSIENAAARRTGAMDLQKRPATAPRNMRRALLQVCGM